MRRKMKYCVNCKHFKKDYYFKLLWIPIHGWVIFIINILLRGHIEYGRCVLAAKKDGKGFVSPKFLDGFYYASIERQSYGNCGPTGKNYEEIKKSV